MAGYYSPLFLGWIKRGGGGSGNKGEGDRVGVGRIAAANASVGKKKKGPPLSILEKGEKDEKSRGERESIWRGKEEEEKGPRSCNNWKEEDQMAKRRPQLLSSLRSNLFSFSPPKETGPVVGQEGQRKDIFLSSYPAS